MPVSVRPVARGDVTRVFNALRAWAAERPDLACRPGVTPWHPTLEQMRGYLDVPEQFDVVVIIDGTDTLGFAVTRKDGTGKWFCAGPARYGEALAAWVTDGVTRYGRVRGRLDWGPTIARYAAALPGMVDRGDGWFEQVG